MNWLIILYSFINLVHGLWEANIPEATKSQLRPKIAVLGLFFQFSCLQSPSPHMKVHLNN